MRVQKVFFLGAILFCLVFVTPVCAWSDPAARPSGRSEMPGPLTSSIEPSKALFSSPQCLPSFSHVVERVAPAVVSIRASEEEEELVLPPFLDVPGFGSLREFFGDAPLGSDLRPRTFGRNRKRKVYTQGSGFVISPDGYIVTNDHVVRKAQDIIVVLKGGSELRAKLVGSDEKSDLALLKVNYKGDLPYVEFDHHEDVRAGDWVLAVGNPFGLGGTVTVGIVSARGRNIGAGPYDDFIQISASINRGNSGGPAFDLRGRVIGVNTAIMSPTGGNVGIGFAIPASTASRVVSELKAHGVVRRGWLGAVIQNVDSDMARVVGLSGGSGAMVTHVEASGPAERAGLRAGDIILKVGDKTITGKEDLGRVIAQLGPGKTVKLVCWRSGKEMSLDVKVQELGVNKAVGRVRRDEGDRGVLPHMTPILGFNVVQVRDVLEVVSVQPGSRAEEKGVHPGDVVLEVGGVPVRSIAQFKSVVEEQARAFRKRAGKTGEPPLVLLHMARRNTGYYVVLPAEAR